MDPLALEHAVATFERIHGLVVTVHDLEGHLAPRLRPDRQWHRQAPCQAVKAMGHAQACFAFDAGTVRQALASQPDGRVHRCHAGFIEWAVPLRRDGRLAAVLFAGVRRAGPGLAAAAPPTSTPIRWPGRFRQPPPVGGAQAEPVLEHLRQLRSRLVELLDGLAAVGAIRRAGVPDVAPPVGIQGVRASDAVTLVERKAVIADALANLAHAPVTLRVLAARLGLSPSHCSRVVREAFGAGFARLAAERRLAVAAELLRHSSLPLAEIVRRSGYRDRSRFHRAFRARHGTTPAAFRRQGSS